MQCDRSSFWSIFVYSGTIHRLVLVDISARTQPESKQDEASNSEIIEVSVCWAFGGRCGTHLLPVQRAPGAG